MSQKEKVFSYFKSNPEAVWDSKNTKHYKLLGVNKNTYIRYKKEYKKILKEKEKHMLVIKNPQIYFRGRQRQKFYLDDSRL